MTPSAEQIRQAFQEYDRTATIYNFKVACCLGIVLMPAGILLDYFVYQQLVPEFLALRILSSVLIGVFLAVLLTPFARKHYRFLGVALAMLPSFFISLMVYLTPDGAVSPYYAGLNLVVLVVGFVMHWTFRESFLAVTLVVIMYALACILNGNGLGSGVFVNNLYFLILTGIIVITGRYFHSQLRFREFALRYELDLSRGELEETNQKLRELDQVKSRFFANISHELRTPLTLLLAPLEIIMHRVDPAFDEEIRNLFGTMHSNGMRLLKLINDLLDLVRLESGRMDVKREPLEIGDFIKGLVSAVRQVADDKYIRLETSVQPALGRILADGDKLEKVVLNLVFNALKFTPRRGTVMICADRQGDDFMLVVSDTGMGISEMDLPFIFDRFWQADTSSRRKFQGAGIGLSLVKELIELQGGRVAVESEVGKGTTFTVRLPYLPVDSTAHLKSNGAAESGPSSAESEPNAEAEERITNLYRRAELFPALTPVHGSLPPIETWIDGKGRRVLIADDEPDMLRFLKSQLSSGYQVLEAADGQQAIDKASQFLPDIILLDMMMPEKDGVQACRELRARTPTQSVPIIMLTARADEKTKLDALAAGVSDFLAKPFSTTELHVRIKNLVDSHHYQTKLAKQNHMLERTIDQLKETESQLVESEKMRSLGQLSAGMIHEINNPLNFATTGLFTLRGKAKMVSEDQRAEYVEIVADVEEGVKRVKDLVLKMREFSYADNTRVEAVEVSQILGSALRFLSHEWKDKVEIQQQISDTHRIWANKNRLTQVILNLLQNSLDALARKSFDAEKPTVWIETSGDSQRSTLIIRDNGAGIAPEHLDRIFDPFFTTKDVGQGMGLGLSICYRIVQDYAGRISVRTELGKYSEFRLEFPAKEPAAEMAVG
jgi:signal transduction histidine kinase